MSIAREHVIITSEDVEVILHAQKSVLCNHGGPWLRKEDDIFDIIMGAYDYEELSELIYIYMLCLIGTKYNSKYIGLFGLSLKCGLGGCEGLGGLGGVGGFDGFGKSGF